MVNDSVFHPFNLGLFRILGNIGVFLSLVIKSKKNINFTAVKVIKLIETDLYSL